MSDTNTYVLNIRLARKSEAQSLVKLLYDSFLEYKQFYTEKGFRATTLSALEVEERIEKKIVWVALHEEVIVGTLSILPSTKGMLIKSVAVAPTARRRGVGKALMKHGEEIARQRQSKCLELTTTAFLYEALLLYESFGFERCGREDLFGTPLIKMTKILKHTPVLPGFNH